MSLQKYKAKRSFHKTPEPEGKIHKKSKVLRFVVQKHHASRLHYDFRLEMEGVLKSWAVPKGPSLDPKEKRLAMMVEDHPYDYRTFEGVIPEGNYGAGKVIVWDEGTYEALGPLPEGTDEEEYLLESLANGNLKIVMHGQKLQGEFALVRFKKAGNKNWLLIKHNDEYASDKDVTEQNESVKTGLDVEEVGTGKIAKPKKEEKIVAKDVKKVKDDGDKSPMPREVKPMLAELADFPFDNKDYIFEMKWDGYRAIAEIENGNVRLYSRNNQDFTGRYAMISEALASFGHNAVLDGEIVVMDDKGRSRFQLLQDYGQRKAGKIAYNVFDLLYLDGFDIRSLPLIERKKFLKDILKENDLIRFSEHIEERGIKLYELAQKQEQEGIIAKKKNSQYVSRRTSDWLKIKHVKMQEAVICGFTEPKGVRKEFGALILGIYENNELRYVGHTGGGFDEKKLKDVRKLLEPLVTEKSPFTRDPKTNTPATWVKPKLVCQVKFSEWTNEGIMRQPIYLGLREDKKPKEVTYEVKSEDTRSKAKGAEPEKPKRTFAKVAPKEEKVQKGKATLTHLDKIYWPDDGYTKGDLIAYYEAVSEYILPYLKGRPISLNRFPNGIEGESFFQKDLVNRPDWVKTVKVYSESDKHYLHWLVCNDKDTLLYIANLGSIEINPWNSRYEHKDYPDYMIIDLDPEGIPFKEVIRTAHTVKKILDDADIDCFLKTSGKTGLHILVPLKAKYTYEQTKQFAQIVANKVFEELPDITSVVRDPKKREHKIYVDFLQNIEGQTIAAPYCVRPVPKAPVSTPLEWKELTDKLDPKDFTIKTILPRLKKKGDIWEPFLKHKGINMLKALKALA